MKNTIKAYLISVLIFNVAYLIYFCSLYLKIFEYDVAMFVSSKYFVTLTVSTLIMTVRFVALMFIIVLPLFKLVTKYPHLTWVIVFMSGFLVPLLLQLINRVTFGQLTMYGLYVSIVGSVIFAAFFVLIFWWLNRRQKDTKRNLIDDFS